MQNENYLKSSERILSYSTVMRSVLSMFLLLFSAFSYGQTYSIKGEIIDKSTLEPIVSATIVEKGSSSNGTLSDLDGKFTLSVDKGSTITISYIGYLSKSIQIINDAYLNIELEEDVQLLSEVVVVGFGTQKKVNLTGSVGTIDSKSLESRPVMTATQALQGLVPGLNISQSNGMLENRANINIRGVATIGDGSTGGPLILIDGMEGDINTINPQDIDNISVLKDAAAASIYGSRAPFGVILVTTKQGKQGKPVVNYNNSFRWNDPLLLPKMTDSYTFATYFNDANSNSGSAPQFDDEHLQRILDFQNGKINTTVIKNPNNPNYWADGYLFGNDNVDWYDALYRSWVFSQEHNFSVNGGSDNTNYYLSFNYLDQNGLMEYNQDTYDRFGVTAKTNIKVTDWAELQYSGRFIREDYGRPSFLRDDLFYNLARQGWPTLPLYDPNGFLYNSPSPALNLRDGGRGIWQTDDLYQQGKIVLEPITDWKTMIEYNLRVTNSNEHWAIQKTYNHDVNGNPFPSNNNSHVHEGNSKSNFTNWNIYSEYSKSIASGHSFKSMLGFQSELLVRRNNGMQREGIIIPGQPYIDLTTGYDSYGKAVTPTLSGANNHWATAGFFGRINYDFKERYLAEINLRYDGTSRFRVDNRWKMFPSVSLGWNIAREDFWKNLEDKIGTLKIRASYGELGNQNTSSWYPTYLAMNVKASDGSWLINGSRPNTAQAPGLISQTMTWESINTWNLGLDAGALNGRLTGSIDYYKRKTLNMIGPAFELPVVLGTSVPKTNNTDLETSGFELLLSWRNFLKNGFNYGITFTLADSRTKITRYPNDTGKLDTYRKGMMMGEIWGYETIGIAKTQEEMNMHLNNLPNGGQNALGSLWEAGDIMYADLNGDGRIDSGANTIDDHGDLKVIGNNTPRYQFGLDLNAGYKGFDFRLFFQGVMKRDYFQSSYYFWGTGNWVWDSTVMEPHLDYFRSDDKHHLGQNINSYFPRPLFNSNKNKQTQSRYLQNAAYIRLKNVQLGYTLPSSLSNKLSISKLRLFISGENLWTGTSLIDVFDPETIDGGWGGNVYPLTKTISAGLSLNF